MSDIIVALFTEEAEAEDARTELVRMGFATDRVAVSSRASPGPAQHAPSPDGGNRFHRFFKTLLADSTLRDDGDTLAERVEGGATALLIHPRGLVELHDAEGVLDRHRPDLVKRDCRESVAPTPFVGEHAAGKR